MKQHEYLKKLIQVEKRITSKIIEVLEKVEATKEYQKLGYSSLFVYLTKGLGYSEPTAHLRISCMRLMKEMPELKQKVDAGKLHYTTLARVNTHIKAKPIQEKREILKSLEGKSTREAIQEVEKQSEAPTLITEKRHYKDKVRITIEMSHEEYKKLERLKALKSHSCPSYEKLFLTLITKELKQYKKTTKTESKSKNPRYIPKTLRNELLQKANYQCQHPGCEQTHFLQIDHKKPIRKGGQSTFSNLQVLCSAHNQSKG